MRFCVFSSGGRAKGVLLGRAMAHGAEKLNIQK
jgi:hypothetical protein